MRASEAFDARDAELTIGYQNELLMRNKAGQLAFGLFRAVKRSQRAKAYRGSLRRSSYGAKDDALKYIDYLLQRCARELHVEWGWQRDNKAVNYEHVLYVDLPGCGQASFHCSERHSQKPYNGKWDESSKSTASVLMYCENSMHAETQRPLTGEDIMFFGKYTGAELRTIEDGYCSYLREWRLISQWSCLHDFLGINTGVPSA